MLLTLGARGEKVKYRSTLQRAVALARSWRREGEAVAA